MLLPYTWTETQPDAAEGVATEGVPPFIGGCVLSYVDSEPYSPSAARRQSLNGETCPTFADPQRYGSMHHNT
jgi:hypothetical protein